MPTIIDPLGQTAQEVLQESRAVTGEAGAAEVARVRKRTARKPAEPAQGPQKAADTEQVTKMKADFRVFLIALWRYLLNSDPSPAMLDMAWYLQHGPDRSVIMAFRGFSKSWITGAYALWRLLNNPQEKILVVSGSQTRAIATTNWCLMIIMDWPVLQHLKPLPHQRQSSKAFDVGPATPEQSPSFHALGIGGQIVGFRGDCIIPDDVETQQNSLTVDMREKVAEAVKEFDSVLKPGGVIKYLGTAHDEDTLYLKLLKRGYSMRIWPVFYPNQEQIKRYGDRLAPWILSQLKKLGPPCVGTSIMPTRFTDDDLAKRRLSLGESEFRLQFLLDTSLSDREKYPLRINDLSVMSLDMRNGPDQVIYSGDPENRITDLPVLGFEGDTYHAAIVPVGTSYKPYSRIIGFVDSSGRGSDETSLVILAELNGTIFWLHLWAAKAGYDPETLTKIAQACVKFRVHKLVIEANFGDGMFAALLQPILTREWARHNASAKKNVRLNRLGTDFDSNSGTSIEEVRASNQMAKEKRILSVLEPVTQQHRLVVDRTVIEWDYQSLQEINGEDTRHRYSCMHQFTHLTRERDCLHHDDRIDSLAGAMLDFADIIGVDPEVMSAQGRVETQEEELEKLFGDMDEGDDGLLRPNSRSRRNIPKSTHVSSR